MRPTDFFEHPVGEVYCESKKNVQAIHRNSKRDFELAQEKFGEAD